MDNLFAIIIDGLSLMFGGALLLSFAAMVTAGIVLIGCLAALLLVGLGAWTLDGRNRIYELAVPQKSALRRWGRFLSVASWLRRCHIF